MFDFRQTEEKILRFWEDHKIFEKSLENRKKAKRFVFFEGPPTANGHPHMGHFEGRVFKDVFNRYKTMRGFFVLRKAGWDTHGLPVELEVEKQLGFKNKKDIEEYGIAAFNRKCRESVWKYKQEWEDMTKRMAFWVDLEQPYVTYETPYMESIWAILKKIWDKGLLYLAHKVVPFCIRCGTPLSSHEVAQGYQTVKDRSVYIKFKVKHGNDKVKKGDYILAWTTTPWTLPGNLALAIGRNIDYIVVKSYKDRFVVAKELAEKVIVGEFSIEAEVKGTELVGLEYEPIFDVEKLKSEKSYKVYAADFVSTSDGTGVVHTAVMYGEDDYNLGTQLGLPKVHTVDEQGKFTGVGKDFDGLQVKHKDKPTEEKTTQKIIDYLKEKDLLLKEEEYEHEYPFCWRCSTPLLYYAKNSWFIKMSAVRGQIIKNNQTVNWIPEHIKEGRFGQWLKEGKDWAISRERYWGTPLPIWKCVKCENMKMAGSVSDLEKASVSSGNTYILMRHGASLRNHGGAETIIGSRLESDKYPLTEDGKIQALKSAEQIQKLHEKIDLIFASPFLRTKETAETAGKVFHKTIEFDERLAEMRHDQNCEGKSHDLCPTDNRPWDFDTKDDHGTGTGESYNEVRRRVYEFMSELETKYKNKKILIVTHGAPVWMLSVIGRGLTATQAKPEWNGPWLLKLAGFMDMPWKNIPRNELGELDLHRPFVDVPLVKCDKCGAQMKRIPDLIDVWFDSGTMPYAQWHYPFENEKLAKEQFPADFIVEGIDQTRGWFYTLLAISTLLDKGAPYKNVMSLGHVLDEKGQKLSKSKGNYVSPNEVMDQFGVDTARWFFYTINSPGDSKNFSEKELKERLTGFMGTLQNCVRFYELYSKDDKGEVNIQSGKFTSQLDQWIISRLHGLIKEVTGYMEVYDAMNAARAIERFMIDDFSKWWLRLSRKRPEALGLLRAVLLELSKLLAPFTPYTAEDIHMRLHPGIKAGTESVHLHDWPKALAKFIKPTLEDEMKRAQEATAKGLALRKDKQIKVRQPLALFTVPGAKFGKDLEEILKDELNVKEVKYAKAGEPQLDTSLTPELKAEGLAREFMRQLQDMRKESGCHFDHKVYAQWFSEDEELSAAIFHWEDNIKKETLLSGLVKLKHDDKPYSVEKEIELDKGKKIWIGIRK